MMIGILNRIVRNLKNSVLWIINLPNNYDQERRSSKKYIVKYKLCKDMWIVSGIIVAILIQNPAYFALAVIILLITTFVAFMILDETE